MFLIASWGSSGAGKTTVAMALASSLARRKKDVLVLSSEMRTPELPVLLPTVTGLTGNNSIGPLLTASDALTEAALKDRMIRHPKSNHIYCMGLVSGETAAFTYGPPTRSAAVSLFQLLGQTPFQYVIVDCDSNPLYDQTTLAALEYAQLGLMVLTPDVKGYEFRKAQLGWLGNSDVFHMDKFIQIANPVFTHTPIKDAQALFGDFAYTLPFSAQAAEKMMAGELLTGFDSTPGAVFEQTVSRLTDQIESEEEKHHAGNSSTNH